MPILQSRVRQRSNLMSALGQKRTFAMQQGMSALPVKADICGATRDVRFRPIADIKTLDPRVAVPGEAEIAKGRNSDRLRNPEFASAQRLCLPFNADKAARLGTRAMDTIKPLFTATA